MMPQLLPIPPTAGPIHGTIRPPGSKSLTNRAMVVAALAEGSSRLNGVLDSEDTRVMARGLAALGIEITADWARGTLEVVGRGGTIPRTAAEIDTAASGTTMRFLAAVCGLGRGRYRLDGTPRMRCRPIGDLVDGLRALGIQADTQSPGRCPPVTVSGPPRDSTQQQQLRVRAGTSSQFASGLAMIGPCLAGGMELEFEGPIVSRPYLEMTHRVMEDFGGRGTLAATRWTIPPGGYRGRAYEIEPDASAASYFLAVAAITGGSMRIEGLSRDSLQGDVAFAEALEAMGCTLSWEPEAILLQGRAASGIEIDMNAISDTLPTLAVVALFAEGPTTIRNVAHVRDKETDRIGDLARELRRLGAHVEEYPDGLRIEAGSCHAATLATYDDHRMAMSLALAGLRIPGVMIEDPLCVGKTFPGFWEALAQITGKPFERPASDLSATGGDQAG